MEWFHPKDIGMKFLSGSERIIAYGLSPGRGGGVRFLVYDHELSLYYTMVAYEVGGNVFLDPQSYHIVVSNANTVGGML